MRSRCLKAQITPPNLGSPLPYAIQHYISCGVEARCPHNPVLTIPNREVSLPRFRHLEFTRGIVIGARRLLSSTSFPRGVHSTVQGPKSNPCANWASLLSSSPRTADSHHHHQVLGFPKAASPIQQRWVVLLLQLKTPPIMYRRFKLFATGAVCEFHLKVHPQKPPEYLSWPLKRLPV
jgi:hypothetical protein